MKKNEQKISAILKEFVQQKQIQRGYNQSGLQKFWQDKMGPTINKYTSKIALRKDILVLSISSSALKQELIFSKKKLLQLFAEEFGENVVKDIKFL